MRNKNTLIMAAVAAVLLTAVYFLEIRGADERAEAERVADRLLRFEAEEVTGLRLRAADREITAQRDDDGIWRLTAPYTLPANGSAIDNIVSRLQSADHEQLVDEAPEDLTRFGLAEPVIDVALDLADGSSLSLALGADTPVGFNVYVRPGAGDAVYTTAAGLKDAVDKTLFDLRDRSIMAFDVEDVGRLDLTRADFSASLRRQPDVGDGIARWDLTEPIETAADADIVGVYVQRLRNDNALAYPSDDPSDEELAAFGLDDPQMTVRVWTGDDAALTLEIGAESEDPAGYYARRLGSDSVFVAPASLFDEAPDSITALRNRTVVAFARDRVDAIDLDNPSGSLRLEKDGIDWRITAPRPLEGDSATVASLLTATLDLNAAEFADGEAGDARFGFADPWARVAFELEALPGEDAGTGRPEETVVLLVGGETTIAAENETEGEEDDVEGEDAEPTPARYVAVDGESTVYVVEQESLENIAVDLFAVRSKTLVAFAQSEVSRLEIAGENGGWTVTKDEDGVWSPDGAGAPDAGEAVDTLLWDLNYLSMEGVIVEPDAGDSIDLTPYALDAPTWTLRAFVGDEMVADLTIGAEVPGDELGELPQLAPRQQIYAAVAGVDGVFRIDATLRDNLEALIAALQ